MVDLFDLFRMDNFESPQAKKKEKKPQEEKKTPQEKKPQKLLFPLTISLNGKEYIISNEGEEKQSVTEKEVLEIVEKRWSNFPADICSLEYEEKQLTAYITYSQTGSIKGTIPVVPGCRLLLGAASVNLEDIMEEISDHIDIAEIQQYLKRAMSAYYPEKSKYWNEIAILHSVSANILVPIFPSEPVKEIKVEENLFLEDPDGEIQMLPKAEFAEGKITAQNVEEYLEKNGYCFRGRMIISETTSQSHYRISFQQAKKEADKSKEQSKGELFPVDQVVLSLYYTKYTLSTEDFDGKEKVTQGELLAYLVRQGHTEYEYVKEVKIKYLEKGKMLLVSNGGSKKG